MFQIQMDLLGYTDQDDLDIESYPLFTCCEKKGLNIVYIIKIIEHKNDMPPVIDSNNVGITISIVCSLSVQLLNVIKS